MNPKAAIVLIALSGFSLQETVSEENPDSVRFLTEQYEKAYQEGIRYSLARGLYSELVRENRERIGLDEQDIAIVYGTPEYYPGYVLWATSQDKTRYYRVSASEAGMRVEEIELELQFEELVETLREAIDTPYDPERLKRTGNPISEYHLYIKHGADQIEKTKLGMKAEGVFEILNELLFGDSKNRDEALDGIPK